MLPSMPLAVGTTDDTELNGFNGTGATGSGASDGIWAGMIEVTFEAVGVELGLGTSGSDDGSSGSPRGG